MCTASRSAAIRILNKHGVCMVNEGAKISVFTLSSDAEEDN